MNKRNPLHGYNNLEENKNLFSQDVSGETIPYYTIPANTTAVKDKLMTALAGRICY